MEHKRSSDTVHAVIDHKTYRFERDNGGTLHPMSEDGKQLTEQQLADEILRDYFVLLDRAIALTNEPLSAPNSE